MLHVHCCLVDIQHETFSLGKATEHEWNMSWAKVCSTEGQKSGEWESSGDWHHKIYRGWTGQEQNTIREIRVYRGTQPCIPLGSV